MSQSNFTPSKPQFTNQQIQQRETALTKCFNAVNISHTGYINSSELEYVSRLFNPNANDYSQESKIIMNKLDTNHDGVIDINEWRNGLLDLFKFMNDGAFNKHIDELLLYIERGTSQQQQQQQQQNTKSSPNSNNNNNKQSITA